MSKLIINTKKYPLSETNYIQQEFLKSQIVIGNTFSNDMKHYIGWKTRLNGNTKKTAAFSIDISGRIYQHFDPKFYCEFIGNNDIDKQIIPILLENRGWLFKDNEKNEFIDWIGNIYNKEDKIFEKRWRNFNYWANYNDKQIKSLSLLVKDICNKFNIPLETISHNTKFEQVNNYRGILYKSNYNSNFTDVSPAFSIEYFKTKLNN